MASNVCRDERIDVAFGESSVVAQAVLSFVGLPHFMMQRRNFVMSLPLVFVTGVVLNSFHGLSTDPLVSTRPFDDSTRWTVVGILGGLARVLSTALLVRR